MPGFILNQRAKRTGGFSLVDVVIALAVLAVGVLGVISLLLMLKTRNEAHSTSRHSLRACQEVMELVLAEMKLFHSQGNLAGWTRKWNEDIPGWQPRKVVILDKDRPDATEYQGPNPKVLGREETNCGHVRIEDVSDPALPNSLYEISVWVDTTGLTTPPIKTRLVTRRSPIE